MKKLMTNLKKAKVKAFTLVEMLVVLLIISVLLLLFVPNLTKQKDAVDVKEKLDCCQGRGKPGRTLSFG